MGKVLLAGAEVGCSQEALTVVAMAATDPVWLTPRSALLATQQPCHILGCLQLSLKALSAHALGCKLVLWVNACLAQRS